jgi:hypothetical protein
MELKQAFVNIQEMVMHMLKDINKDMMKTMQTIPSEIKSIINKYIP